MKSEERVLYMLLILLLAIVFAAIDIKKTEDLKELHEIELNIIREQYRTNLEAKQTEYANAVLELRAELHATKVDYDMATNHIELLNADH